MNRRLIKLITVIFIIFTLASNVLAQELDFSLQDSEERYVTYVDDNGIKYSVLEEDYIKNLEEQGFTLASTYEIPIYKDSENDSLSARFWDFNILIARVVIEVYSNNAGLYTWTLKPHLVNIGTSPIDKVIFATNMTSSNGAKIENEDPRYNCTIYTPFTTVVLPYAGPYMAYGVAIKYTEDGIPSEEVRYGSCSALNP